MPDVTLPAAATADAGPIIEGNMKNIRQLKNAPASIKMAGFAMTKLVEGRIDIRLPDGRTLRFQGQEEGPTATLQINDYAGIKRVMDQGNIGFAEGFIAGEWETPDLPILLESFTRNLDRMPRLMNGGPLWGAINALRHRFLNKNTKAGSAKNIYAHYDLGNRFYERWLDPSMTYSSAKFSHPGQSLADGQTEKYKALADMIDLKPGMHVLEIGCGWGGFAEYAAKERGARVTGITISKEQHVFATKRLLDAGLSDMTEIKLVDYRDVEGSYDAVASIEMFEAVGEAYWPSYFDKVHSVLKPGGKAGLQIITIDDRLFDDYRSRADFIQRYIFPGGMLPSVARLKEEVARAGLVFHDMAAFGESYADTLAEWAVRFKDAWHDIAPLGFDEKFKRLWKFYLAYCEAGFRTKRIDVAQFSLVRT
jgi:cyclopropane-fatty-acyl-phospholipid synthase